MRSVLKSLIVLYLDWGLSMQDPGFGAIFFFFFKKGNTFCCGLLDSRCNPAMKAESSTCSMYVFPITYLRSIDSLVACFPVRQGLQFPFEGGSRRDTQLEYSQWRQVDRIEIHFRGQKITKRGGNQEKRVY